MRALLTGSSGFVGTWLTRHLVDSGDEVLALPDALDIGDTDGLIVELSQRAPDVVYHLAALTHVGRSWEEPAETFRVNALGTLQLLEAVRCAQPAARVIVVSSAEVYGRGGERALTEADPLRPVTPYAASKVSAEFVGLQAFLGRGLDVVRVRPFNHVGPGQSDAFVVSALARRIVEAELAGTKTIAVGDLSPLRDFTDVRDIVRAYRLVAERGIGGEVYNVCSGTPRSIRELLDALVGDASSSLVPVEDPALVRPVEVPIFYGDASALRKRTGWEPQIPLSTTLSAVLDDWRKRLSDSTVA